MMQIYIDKDGELHNANSSDVTGMVKCELKEDGSTYAKYNLDGTADLVVEQETMTEDLITTFTGYIETYIQDEVVKYNKTHGLQFKDVHSCANYKDVESYTHKDFCSAVWLWNVKVWEEARAIQKEIMQGLREVPTKEELLSELTDFSMG